MSETQPKTAIRTTSKPITTQYDVWFDSDIESSSEFHEQFYIMRQAVEGDLINVHISSFGGCVSTVSTFQDIVKKSDAHFHGILEGYGYSAGGAIFLLCDSQEIADMADMMIHTIQTSSSGSSQSVESRGIKVGKGARQFMERIYDKFLTQEEIEEALIGKEFWFTSDEVKERLEKRQTICEQEAIEEAKETYTPEFYAESVLNDIMEDCQGFGYDIEDILQLLTNKVNTYATTKEETPCEDCLVGSETLEDDDELSVQYFPHGSNSTYDLYFNKLGEIWDGVSEPWVSFAEEVDSWNISDLKQYAVTLNVTYVHNTKKETLAKNLDLKVKEIIDSLNVE